MRSSRHLSCAKLSGIFLLKIKCPTRHTRLTRPTSPSASREAQRPLGGAASPLPHSPPHGQRGRCPSRVVKFCAKLLADGVAKSCAKPTGRRFAALEPSGAAGWAVKVLHGTHGVRRGISVREAADRRWRSRADETLTGAPNERRNAVRDPKTPSRPSPCGSPRARVVPEP